MKQFSLLLRKNVALQMTHEESQLVLIRLGLVYC